MQLPRATRLVVRIAGKRMYLWRAVDHEGEVLDMLVQRRRDAWAALRLMRKLLKKHGFVPKLLETGDLKKFYEKSLNCHPDVTLRAYSISASWLRFGIDWDWRRGDGLSPKSGQTAVCRDEHRPPRSG